MTAQAKTEDHTEYNADGWAASARLWVASVAPRAASNRMISA
jgi:hypothetical protein